MDVTGRVHSIQSLGTVDGPGIRFVVFFQGCPLRCKCCHNPDTWDFEGGTEYTAEQIVKRAIRCREYFGEKGGITLSGGEPVMQPEFAREIFRLCHENGINTCLDTSGVSLSEEVKALIAETDRVLLDIKYVTDELYRENVGGTMSEPMEFLKYLDGMGIPVTLRQVTIPGINDDDESVLKLGEIARAHRCVDKIELLPFRKICQMKYDKLGIEFPFGKIPEPSSERMKELRNLISEYTG